MGHILFVGLEEKNIKLLKNNKPINFKADDVGFPGLEIVIMFGETNTEILEDLRSIGVIIP